MLSTFEACIRVGRIARAQLMLKVITEIIDRESPLLLGAHNMFLKALLGRAVAEKSKDSEGIRIFFGWYEDQMKRILELKGDATTFALLLEGSVILSEEDPALGKRYIAQYVEQWKSMNMDIVRVLELQILSDAHVLKIAQVRKPCFI